MLLYLSTALLVPCSPRHWQHSEMWWPRLFKAHAAIAWDDYEKDYSDLPEEVLQRHRWAARHEAGRVSHRADWLEQRCLSRTG